MAVEEFIAWWTFTYPAYNADAVSSASYAMDGAIVGALLKRRPADRLKHMAIVMWTVRGKPYWRGGHIGGKLLEPDPAEAWIVKSDRSLHVLRHKADWLDRQLANYPRWWLECPHTPRCDGEHGCQRRLELLTAPEALEDGPREP